LKISNLNKEIISCAWMAGKLPVGIDESYSGLSGTFIVKGVFKIHHDSDPTPWEKGPGFASGDRMIDGDKKLGLGYASDFVPFKANADFSAIGTAYPPVNATTHFLTTMKVGEISRSVGVIGERQWKHNLLGEEPGVPAQVKATQLSWNNARGGLDYPLNPLGRGRDGKEMPLLEDPMHLVKSTAEVVPPSLFAPHPSDSPLRRSKVGTYNKEWVETRWPWMPQDFDCSYYNAPDPRQWIKGYLQGDEALVFENMHPTIPVYRTRLPSLRVRCFVNRTTNWRLDIKTEETVSEFCEVPMVLDTLWVDMDQEKLILVWRGSIPINSLKFRDINRLMVLTERLDQSKKSPLEYEDLFEEQKQSNSTKGDSKQDVVREALAAAGIIRGKMITKMHENLERFSKINPDAAEKIRKEVDTVLAKKGASSALPSLGIPSVQTIKEKTSEAFDHFSSAIKADKNLSAAEKEPHLAQLEKENKAYLENTPKGYIERKAAFDEEFKKKLRYKKSLSDFKIIEGLDLEKIHKEGLALCDLKKADFKGLNLEGVKFNNSDLQEASFKGAFLKNADFTGTNLRGVDFSDADLTAAVLDATDLTTCNLGGATLCGVSLNKSNLSRLVLKEMDFSGMMGKGTSFSHCDLSGAKFIKAQLPGADFTKSILSGANLSHANLESCRFIGVMAREINMDSAELNLFRGGYGSDFTNGSFRLVHGKKSFWHKSILDNADFSKSILPQAQLTETIIRNANFDRCDLRYSRFEDSLLTGTKLTNANLFKNGFNRTDLTKAKLDGSNLYGSSFWGTLLLHATWEKSNILKTSLLK
jgi:uncharacterized protein YjbI with pentapeptide repeats